MRATAVIIKDKQILLVYRYSKKKEYYVLPGGSVEEGEDVEVAMIREAKEETNLDIQIDKKIWEYKNDFDQRIYNVFLVTNFSGLLQLNSPEKERNCKTNRYVLEWHDLNKIKELLIYPEFIKQKIVEEFIV